MAQHLSPLEKEKRKEKVLAVGDLQNVVIGEAVTYPPQRQGKHEQRVEKPGNLTTRTSRIAFHVSVSNRFERK